MSQLYFAIREQFLPFTYCIFSWICSSCHKSVAVTECQFLRVASLFLASVLVGVPYKSQQKEYILQRAFIRSTYQYSLEGTGKLLSPGGWAPQQSHLTLKAWKISGELLIFQLCWKAEEAGLIAATVTVPAKGEGRQAKGSFSWDLLKYRLPLEGTSQILPGTCLLVDFRASQVTTKITFTTGHH